jgi:RNA polymerase sigma-70 factor (ECF subfamily)
VVEDGKHIPIGRSEFTATRWTVVLQARHQGSRLATRALEELCNTYWYPLYVFVRRQGAGPDDAQDITQGFFGALLEKDFLKDIDPARGRFRSFLLAAIKNYFLNEKKKEKRLKRGGDRIVLSLDGPTAESRFRGEPARDDPPEAALDRSWATTVMELALRQLAVEYESSGRKPLFDALRKFLSGEPEAGEYKLLAERLDMSKSALGVAVHRLRKRYGELIRIEVAKTVAHPFEVDEEMRYLHAVLAGP